MTEEELDRLQRDARTSHEPIRGADVLALVAEVKRLEAAIREHWSQRAEDRCWLDDVKLYETAGLPTHGYDLVGSPTEMLKNCERFVTYRCSGGGDWKSYAELEAERDRLAARADGLVKLVCEMTARERELADALRPFAELGDRWTAIGLNEGGQRDDCPAPNSGGLTVGDFRRAAGLLGKPTGAGTGEARQ